jgi:hypothetical protein
MKRALMVSMVALALVMAGVVPAGAEMTAQRGEAKWTVTADGKVSASGRGAKTYGDASGIDLWQPIVGIAVTQSGKGYWLAARDSGVFTYGDAAFHGNLISQLIVRDKLAPGTLTGENIMRYLHGEIVDIVSTGNGYYLLGKDGGVFTFGRLPFHGSLSGKLGTAAVDLQITTDGYMIVGANGNRWACHGGKCDLVKRPTAVPPPTTTPPPPSRDLLPPTPPSNCDPNYAPCIPNVSHDLDCDDIGLMVAVIGTDRHRLDQDGNGIGCEE